MGRVGPVPEAGGGNRWAGESSGRWVCSWGWTSLDLPTRCRKRDGRLRCGRRARGLRQERGGRFEVVRMVSGEMTSGRMRLSP